MKKISLFIIPISLFLFFGLAGKVEAADHYIRAGSTCGINCDGSDWNNAWTTWPSTFIRGDTYYIASGIYAGHKFDTAELGTSVITIQKATTTSHGPATDWDDSYGDGQAIFQSTLDMGTWGWVALNITTGYWIFDGSTGTDNNSSTYGFAIETTAKDAEYIFVYGANLSGLEFRYITIPCYDNLGNHTNYAQVACEVFAASPNPYATVGMKVNHIYTDKCQIGWTMNGSGDFVENNYFNSGYTYDDPITPSNNRHGVPINVFHSSGSTIRYNKFTGWKGMYIESNWPIADGAPMDGFSIYGNIFVTDRNMTACGAGIISVAGGSSITNTKVYNNTIVDSLSPLLYQVVGTYQQSSGNEVKNNLFYNSNGSINVNDKNQPDGSVPIEFSHNSYYHGCTNIPAQTGGDIKSTIDPFINKANGNYYLSGETESGTNLGSPYNIDMDGVNRTHWDRGAYEYTSACTTKGDFTCNGYSISDLQTMISIILGTDTTISYTQADMNNDTLVNISDLQLLINKVLGIN